MIFLTAFITGLMGSFHCVGMCGPLALATPTLGQSKSARFISKIWYHLGRITTYSILGGLFGTFGWGLKLAGFQQSISIVAGTFMILTAILSTQWLENKVAQWWTPLKNEWFHRWMTKKSISTLFGLGLLNGLLPCGLVYVALVAAVATQSIGSGMLFMILFGLGTWPMMVTISFAGSYISIKTRGTFKKIVPFFTLMIGCLFVLRGMSLGIPYISPEMHQNKSVVAANGKAEPPQINCCHPSSEDTMKKDGCCGNKPDKCTCNH